jgi:hypothetical protein
MTIARAGIARLLARGLRLDGLDSGLTWRTSVNARIPVFADQADSLKDIASL